MLVYRKRERYLISYSPTVSKQSKVKSKGLVAIFSRLLPVIFSKMLTFV